MVIIHIRCFVNSCVEKHSSVKARSFSNAEGAAVALTNCTLMYYRRILRGVYVDKRLYDARVDERVDISKQINDVTVVSRYG